MALLGFVAPMSAEQPRVTPVDLQAAKRVEPIGIEQDGLVFGWKLKTGSSQARDVRQQAYRILVATSARKLEQQTGDVWDSGRVSSQTFWQLPYGGAALRSNTRYFWKAQAWSATNAPGPWSATAHFTTGILHPEEWNAKWITAAAAAGATPLPVFYKRVGVHAQVAQALLSVSGMGQYEVDLNGRDVTKTVLNPGWTNYRKTVSYDTYDVTSLLHAGDNAIAVLLGNGMYNVEETKGRYTKFTGSFGPLKFILQMQVRYRDGSVQRFVSDGSWLTHAGPITFSSIYGGEDYDADALPENWRLADFQPAGWQRAVEVEGPGGVLTSERSSPDGDRADV